VEIVQLEVLTSIVCGRESPYASIAPPMKAVVELAPKKRAGAAVPLPAGKCRGAAAAEAFKTFVAQVAEVSVGDW
jgi:hypothetical protein